MILRSIIPNMQMNLSNYKRLYKAIKIEKKTNHSKRHSFIQPNDSGLNIILYYIYFIESNL